MAGIKIRTDVHARATVQTRQTGKRLFSFNSDMFPDACCSEEVLANDALPSAQPMGDWALKALVEEGQGFLGFQNLAAIYQRAEYRNAVEVWAEHSIKKWIEFSGNDHQKLARIEREFKRLGVRSLIRKIVETDGIYGRGHLFYDFGDSEHPDELRVPLSIDPDKINPSRPLRKIKLVEAMWLMPLAVNTSNPLADDFYVPETWSAYGKTIHTSRLSTLVSRPVPDMLKPGYGFGGQSLVQILKPYVDIWLQTREAVAEIIKKFSIIGIGTDMGGVLGGGDDTNIYRRLDMFNATRRNGGSLAYDKNNEEINSISVPLAGLSELQAQAQEHMASVARIPLSVLLQITPTGLNASSEEETRNFESDVHALQENDIRPIIEKILAIVQLSLFGRIDPTIEFKFLPLREVDEQQQAQIDFTNAQTDAIYATQIQAVSPETVLDALRADDCGRYSGVSLPENPPEPSESEFEED